MITTLSMIRPRLQLVQVRLGHSYTEYIKYLMHVLPLYMQHTAKN